MPAPTRTPTSSGLSRGGPNFGVVTRFDDYTVPVWEIWYEFRVYGVDDLPKVLGKRSSSTIMSPSSSRLTSRLP